MPAPKMAASASASGRWSPTWAPVANGLPVCAAGLAREAEVPRTAASVRAAAPAGYITRCGLHTAPLPAPCDPRQDALSPTTPSTAAGSRPRCDSGLWWERRIWLGVGGRKVEGGGAVRAAAGGGSVGGQWETQGAPGGLGGAKGGPAGGGRPVRNPRQPVPRFLRWVSGRPRS